MGGSELIVFSWFADYNVGHTGCGLIIKFDRHGAKWVLHEDALFPW